MDAAQALADLTEISSQIEAAVVLDDDGHVVASTLDERRAADVRRGRAGAARGGRARAGRRGRHARRSSRSRPATAASSSSATASATIAATTGPEPTVGLVFYDLKTACVASRSRSRSRRPRSRKPKSLQPSRTPMPRRKAAAPELRSSPARSPARSLCRRRGRRRRERVDLYFEDGSMVSLADGSPRRRPLLPLARRIIAARAATMDRRRSSTRAPPRARLPRGRLRPALRQALALLPRQVPLRDAPRPARARSASASRPRSPSIEPDATRSPGPSSARSRSPPRPRSRRGLPFLIVRKAGEGVRHREPDRGRLRAGRARLPGRGRRHLRRGSGSMRSRRCARPVSIAGTAICVVDREEGGADALARLGVRLRAALPCERSSRGRKTAAKPHG